MLNQLHVELWYLVKPVIIRNLVCTLFRCVFHVTIPLKSQNSRDGDVNEDDDDYDDDDDDDDVKEKETDDKNKCS